jgi:hypothetical protein
MEEAQTTFEGLKRYLTSPSVLVASNLGKPLLLYNGATTKVISMVLIVECDETRANSSGSHAMKDDWTSLGPPKIKLQNASRLNFRTHPDPTPCWGL